MDSEKSIVFSELTSGILNANETDQANKKQQSSLKLSKGTNLKPKTLEDEQNIRKTAYNSACKSLNKWDSVVELYKSAPALEYPLFQKDNRLRTLSSGNQAGFSSGPKTEIQSKIDELMGKDKQITNTKQITESEREANLIKSSLNEAKQYHAEIARFKTKMQEIGKRNLLHRKVKSKRFRKITRTSAFKDQYHTKESLRDLAEKADVERAKERMTLKHLGKSKAMKRKVMYGKYDPAIRQQVDEMRSKGKEIMDNKSSLKNLIIADEAFEDTEFPDDDEEIEIVNEDEMVDVDDINPIEQQSENSANDWLNKLKNTANDEIEIQSKPVQLSNTKQKKKSNASATIAEAFASDDIVAHFEAEKLKELEEDHEKLKDKDSFLPGWGTWSGPGIKNEISEVKKAKFIEKTPSAAFNRKDSKMKHVIINENAQRPVRKHQVSKLPYPYTNVKDFENSIATPIGSDWNTPQAHKTMTTPKVSIKKGSVVTPLKAEDVFGSLVNPL